MILDNYIKQDFVKNTFMESCLFVSDIQQAESLAKTSELCGLNILFDATYLKLAFFNKLKQYHPKTKIINCNSSKLRLLNDISDHSDGLIVFDKINFCDDFDIFNNINKMNRILIC